jgi:predicted kinase
MKVLMMIGLPGSGKTTAVQKLVEGQEAVVCSTDDLFMVNGKYQFDFRKLTEYHAVNFQKFAMAVASRVPLVVVDNTNILEAHRAPYVHLAKALGYEVDYQVVGEFTDEACNLYAQRNTHGVPLAGIQRMASAVQLP